MTVISRRSFLQAAVAASAVGATIPRWMMPAGAQPLASNEGMVLIVNLGGGLDSLGLLVPSDGARRAEYETSRGSIALPASSLLPATVDHGLHPAVPGLAQRFAAGQVAIVDGVGLPEHKRSHSYSTLTMQSGNPAPMSTGWMGRHLDGYSDPADGIMSVAVSPTVPLHLKGAVNQSAAMAPNVGMWGADKSWRFDNTAVDAVRAFADSQLDRGPWADMVASTSALALDKASLTAGLSTASSAPNGLQRDAEIAAHVFNADIGTRAIALNAGGWDTHAGENNVLPVRLTLLDRSIKRFFDTLSPALHNRVVVVVVSEFGRRPMENASLGTDHGHAGLSMVIGANVAGGLHSESPSITNVDSQGCMVPTVDLRRVYASVLDTWMGGDSSEALGGTYQPLGLFAASPGTNK